MIRVAAACTASLIAMVLAGAAAAQSSAAPVVNCYDAARNIVTPMLSRDCQGKVVDDAEAERIRQQRLDRVRAGVMARDKGPYPGKRLASTGTGFFIAKDGSLLTNNHVVDNCKLMSVESPDGRRVRGRVMATSADLDLALVAAEQTPDAVARFSVVEIAPGLRADLIGYPTQGIAPEKPIFSPGEIAEQQHRFRDPDRFLVRADVRSGNSGGPVLDQSGLVLGIVFAQVDTPKVREKTGELLPDIAVVVRNRAVRAFLEANGATAEVVSQAPALGREAVIEQARAYVARIACWR